MGVRNAIYQAAWPLFACQNCIGMIEYGCQCDVYEAIAPGVGPTKFNRFLRRLYNYAWNNSLSDKHVHADEWRQFA